MKNLFTTLCLLINTWMFAQIQEIEWTKNYGGSGMDFTYGSTLIQQTTDGGYIFAAGSDSSDNDVTGNHGETDVWVVKLDEAGEIEWQRSYGGSGYEEPRSIQQTTDGGYIFAGTSNSNDGDVSQNQGSLDYWIVKLDETGIIEWQKSYGGSSQDLADVIHQTTDGGYIVAGNSNSTDGDVAGNETEFLTGNWIIKLDGAGEIEGQQFHARGDMLTNRLYDFILTSDGGYMAVGMVSYLDPNTWQPNTDFLILKLNEAGEVEWEQTWGGLDSDFADAVQETTDGGYIISGYSFSANIFPNHGEADAVVLKLNSEGGIEWYKNYGGEFYETFNAIEQTPDGGYMCFGWSDSVNGDIGENFGLGDYWLVRLDPEGEILWEKSFGGSEYDTSYGGFVPTSDGGYILIGESESNDGHVPGNYGQNDIWIIKLSENISVGECVQPSDITISTVADSVVSVSWTENGDATQWEIKYGETGFIQGDGTIIFDNDGSPNETIDGLTQGVEYDVYVRAICDFSESEWEGPASFVIEPEPCSLPTNVVVDVITPSMVYVTWAENGGATQWEIEYGETGFTQGEGTTITDNDGIPGEAISGLEEGINYDVYIRAICEFSGSEWVGPVTFNTEEMGITEFENKMILYPNPTTGIINIRAKEKISSVSVYNSVGQKMEFNSLNNENTSIDISNLSSGVYFVEITLNNNKTIKTYKVIKR